MTDPVLVTRPAARKGTLGPRLQAAGVPVTDYPCVAMVPLSPCPALEEALNGLSRWDWAAFSCPESAELFLGALAGRPLPAGVKLAAMGPGTAKVLEAAGRSADLIPPVFDGAHLAESLRAAGAASVLMICGTEGVSGFDAPCTLVPVFRTVYDNPLAGAVCDALRQGRELVVTFTSLATVRGFVQSLGEEHPALSRVTAACIGRQTADAAEQYGMRTITAGTPTLDALIETVRRI